MESMIKIDNGVDKKAMDEVAAVAITLFEAASTHGTSQRNLGKALGLLGKTIKTGGVNIAHCNLSTTLERKEGVIPHSYFTSPDKPFGGAEKEYSEEQVDDLNTKIHKLTHLAESQGDVVRNEQGMRRVVMERDAIRAIATYDQLLETEIKDLPGLLINASGIVKE